MSMHGGKTLLVVEDDDVFRERLATAMRKRGFETTTASGVAEGLAAIEANAPDYAIVDLRLEDGSGLTIVEALERRRADARALILTAYGDIPTAVAAARIGAVDYLAKPATATEIHDTLMAPKGERPPPPEETVSPNEARLEHIVEVYRGAGRNVSETARLLNMHRRTLQRILRRAGIQSDAA